MIHILSYYNLDSKNGGANRLNCLADYLSYSHKVNFLTLSQNPSSNGHLTYWKNASVFIWIWVIVYKVMFYLGLSITKDPYYKRQTLKYYKANITSADTLIVSYPTIDDIVVGIKIFKASNCRLNIDFRDSILDYPLEKLSWLQRRRVRNIFESVGKSDRIIATAVSPPICDCLRFYFKNVHCITNFRQNICSSPFRPEFGKDIKVLYFGSIENSYDRSTALFINAIRVLVSQNKARKFTFSFFGSYSNEEIASFASLKDLDNLTINFSGPLASESLGKYDFAVLWGVPGNPGYVSSKFFSYIQLKLPIVAAAKGNQVAEYISEYSVGYSYDFDANFLSDGFSDLNRSQLLYNSDLSIFSSEYVLKEWSALIN